MMKFKRIPRLVYREARVPRGFKGIMNFSRRLLRTGTITGSSFPGCYRDL